MTCVPPLGNLSREYHWLRDSRGYLSVHQWMPDGAAWACAAEIPENSVYVAPVLTPGEVKERCAKDYNEGWRDRMHFEDSNP